MVRYLNLMCLGRKEDVFMNGLITLSNFLNKYVIFWHNSWETDCNVSYMNDEVILIWHVPDVHKII
jgi:hypothetical protein